MSINIKIDYFCNVKALNHLLKELRQNKELSIKEAAKAIKIDNSLLSRFESGSRRPTKKQLLALSELYKVSPKELILQWLSEKLYLEIKDEEFGLEAIRLAESRAAYKNKSFNKSSLIKTLDQLKAQLDEHRPIEKSHFRKLIAYYKAEYTFDSNRIEGNTLSLKETALVVEKGLTISGKSVKEHFEAVNHAEAIDLLMEFVEQKAVINDHLLKQIHALILRGIDKSNSGKYRRVNVRISGSKYSPPEPYLIAKLMEDYFIFYEENCERMHPVVLAAEMHERLVTIHPFADGNGRTARLIMNLILLQAGFPITNISSEDENRITYYDALEEAQIKLNKSAFIEFIFQQAIFSLKDYLKILK